MILFKNLLLERENETLQRSLFMNETQNGTCVQFGTQGTFLDLKFETK